MMAVLKLLKGVVDIDHYFETRFSRAVGGDNKKLSKIRVREMLENTSTAIELWMIGTSQVKLDEVNVMTKYS